MRRHGQRGLFAVEVRYKRCEEVVLASRIDAVPRNYQCMNYNVVGDYLLKSLSGRHNVS